MRGEKSFDYERAGEQIGRAEKKHPEKFPFKMDDPVWVRDQKTGKMEEWRFMAWDPNTGEAIIMSAKAGEEERAQITKKVSRDDVLEKPN